MDRRSITLFFPMFNERDSVEPITRKALEVLSRVADDYEVLIIDDGSSDGSEEIAAALAARDPHVKVIRHAGNRGYGQALRTGFASASKEIVMYTDCDEPVDLHHIPEALERLQGHDMLIGCRLHRWEGWRRFAYSKVYNHLVRVLFGVRVRDVNFSFKFIYREKLERLHLAAGSVFIDGELLAEATRNGLKIAQMPVEYQPRVHGASHFNSIRAATYTFEEILAYWMRRRERARMELREARALAASK